MLSIVDELENQKTKVIKRLEKIGNSLAGSNLGISSRRFLVLVLTVGLLTQPCPCLKT